MSADHATLSRRSFGRLLGLAAVAATVPAVTLRPADAGAARVWCRTDPLFLVGGKVVDVTIGSQLEMFATATGPVAITLTTAPGVLVQHLVSDLGFGHGYAVTYATDTTLLGGKLAPEVRVAVMAPSTADLPVSVSFTRVGLLGQVELRSVETQGRSNQWVSAR